MRGLLALDQVAALFPGKGKDWVRRTLIRQGLVTSVRIGNALFVHQESVEALIRPAQAPGAPRWKFQSKGGLQK